MPDTRISTETRARITAAWPALLSGIASGRTIKSLLAEAGISADMIRCYRGEDPLADKQWADARLASADAYMDEAVSVARNPIAPQLQPDGTVLTMRIDPAHARTYIDTLKWAARVRNPRDYGDKQQIDMQVKSVDLTRIIQDANARLVAARTGRILDHEAGPLLADLL